MYDELVKRLRYAASYDERIVIQDCKEAADAIEEFTRENESLAKSVNEASEILRRRWIPVTERLPENGVHVLLSCKCGSGAYVCVGFHTEKYSMLTQFYEAINADYDEDTDEYYFPKGWWEVVKNWGDYSCVAIEDAVTHWMPLPEPPKEGET